MIMEVHLSDKDGMEAEDKEHHKSGATIHVRSAGEGH